MLVNVGPQNGEMYCSVCVCLLGALVVSCVFCFACLIQVVVVCVCVFCFLFVYVFRLCVFYGVYMYLLLV